MEDLEIKFNSDKLKISARRVGFFGRIRGLMFRSYTCENLLFEFSKEVKAPIHSFFVSFPFLAVWLDSSNRVIEYAFVQPFTPYVCPTKKFRKLVEIPINTKNRHILRVFSSENKKI